MGKPDYQIFEDGRFAAVQDFPRCMCPYPNGTEAQRQWLRGWEAEYCCRHGVEYPQ